MLTEHREVCRTVRRTDGGSFRATCDEMRRGTREESRREHKRHQMWVHQDVILTGCVEQEEGNVEGEHHGICA